MLKTDRLFGIIRAYVESVLGEFELEKTMVFSSTTDPSIGGRRMASKLLPSRWEWCICHMLNFTLVEVCVKPFALHHGAHGIGYERVMF